MPRTDTRYPGAGIDIAVGPDGLVVGTVEGSRVRLQRGSGIVHTPEAPRALLARTLRIAVTDDGEVGCICQVINPDQAALYIRGVWLVLPYGLWGQEPCGIAAVGRSFAWAVVTDRGGTLRVQSEDGANETHPCNTSQGVLYWHEGVPVLADARKDVRVDGQSLFRVTAVHEWGVGYGDNCVIVGRPGYTYTLTQGNPSTPRLAVSGDTLYVAYSQDGPRLVTLTPPYPVDVPAPITIPPFTFPTSIAWFFEDSKRPSVVPSPAPGQWSLIVESGLNPPKPVIIGLSGDAGEDLIAEWANRWSRVRGIFVSEESRDESTARASLTHLAQTALTRMAARGLPHRPIYSYSAGNLWLDIAEIDRIGIQCYPNPDESAASAYARWRPAFLKVKAAGKRSTVVAGFYDRRPLNVSVATINGCIEVYARLAVEFQCEIQNFAWGRMGGASSMPALLPGLMSLAAAVRDTPEIEDDMNKPGVTITEWHEIRPNVLVARAHDRNNPDHYTTEFLIENGHLRVRMTNEAGTDVSNATKRKVL